MKRPLSLVTLVVCLAVLTPSALAWVGGYPVRSAIPIISPSPAPSYFVVNDTKTVGGDYIWVRGNQTGETLYLYGSSGFLTGAKAIGNDTTEVCWYNETGGNGNCYSHVFGPSAAGIYSLSNSAKDASLYGLNGTWEDGPVYNSSGRWGACGSFNGTNNIVIPDSPGTSPPNNFTVIAWIRTGLTADGSIVCKDDSAPADGRSFCLVHETNSILFYVFKDKSAMSVITGTANIEDNAFHMIAGVYTYVADGSSLLDLYIDGGSDAAQITNAVGPISNTATDINIGARTTAASRYRFTGLIDQVEMINRSLSATEIRQRMNNSLNYLSTPLGPESSLPSVAITIDAPTAGTYPDSGLDLVFSATSDNNTYFFMNASIDGLVVYSNASYYNGTNLTVSLNSSLTTDGPKTITVFAKDADNTDTETASITMNMYEMTSLFSNYTTIDYNNYSAVLVYNYSGRCGVLGRTTKVNVSVSGVSYGTASFLCDNTTQTGNGTHIHGAEGSVTLVVALQNYNSSVKAVNTNITYIQDLYPPTMSFGYAFTQGFIKTYNGSGTVTVNDTTPGVYCNVSFALNSSVNVTINDTSLTLWSNISSGVNSLYAECVDYFNRSNHPSATSFTAYVKYIVLIDEEKKAVYIHGPPDNTSIVGYGVDRGYEYNFTATNETSIYYVSNSSDPLRFEVRYPGVSGVIPREFALKYMDNTTRLCVAPVQTFYEQILFSSVNKFVAVKNVLADCFVLGDFTKYGYSDAVMTKAYTIPALYYLYVLNDDGDKILLGSLDGGTATAINLDHLVFSQKAYNVSILTESLSVSYLGNYTIVVNYRNQKEDDDEVRVEIIDNGTTLFSHLETSTPNNITLFFDWSTINLTGELLVINVYRYQDGVLVETITAYIATSSVPGAIHPYVAIIIAALLLFFGLSMVAVRFVFGYFGIAMAILALAILAMSPQNNQYVLFMEGIVLIILVFVVLVYKERYSKIT